MNTEAVTLGASVGVLRKISAYERALENNDPTCLPHLIRLLHATLNPGMILARLDQGARLGDFIKLRPLHRLYLLQFAERWGAGRQTIEAIAASFSPDELCPGSIAEPMVAAARKRLLAREGVTAGPVGEAALVSIGAGCIGWTIPNRWGLRRAEDISRLFNPLALAVHRPQFVVKMIAADFEGYLDPLMLKATVSTGGFETVARADGAALWNHCVGAFWSHRGFRQFTRIMAASLDRFREEGFAETGQFRVFLFNLTNIFSHDATRRHVTTAAEALASRVKGPHGVIGIDSNHRDERLPGLIEIGPRAALIQAPPPSSDYQWSDAKYYNSLEGMDYEFSIMKMIQTCVAGWVEPSV